MSKNKKKIKNDMSDARASHAIWHKFEAWLIKIFGEDYSTKLQGYAVISKVKRYINRNLKEVKIVECDDFYYSGSIILLVPHPMHGISVIFIPQTAEIGTKFFLYGSHCTALIEELSNMKKVYDNIPQSPLALSLP